MIDKLFPRLLNSGKDNRIRNKTEMNDALNVVVTDDFDQLAGANEGGDSGVIKPQKGNEVRNIKTFDLDAVFPPEPVYQRRVLGRISDPRSGVIYMFIYSQNPSEMGVYAYDAYGFFAGGDQAWRPIYTTSEFQFNSTARVVGDVVHITGPNDTYRPILYFTDNENEPRRLDVLRCVENGYGPTGFNYTENSVDDVDLITACTKAPIHPIQFTFEADPTRAQSNFRRIPGLQFAFQCIYFTGEESAISTYSDIAVPEEYLRQGFAATQLELPMFIRLVAPSLVDGMPNFSEEVDRVRLLVRQGNIGAWYEIDEVEWPGFGGNPIVYDFYNDEVLTGLTNEEQNRDFDAHPQVAEAVSVVENRLFYGNYVEGFDEEPIEANITLLYQDRPNEFININIPVRAAVVPIDEDATTLEGDPSNFSNRSTGFVMDLSQLPESLPAGTTITAQIRVAFGGAIEAYQAEDNYHASQTIGVDSIASNAQTLDFANNNAFSNGQQPGSLYASTNADYGALPVGGIGTGVGSPNLRWRTTAEGEGLFGNQNNSPAKVGMHGLSPLRFRGPQGSAEQLTFSFTATATEAITNTLVQISQILNFGLSGGPAATTPANWTVSNSQVNPSYGFDLGLKDPTDNDLYVDYLNDAGTAVTGIEGVGALTLGTGPDAPGDNYVATYNAINTDTPEYAILPTKNSSHLDVSKLIFPVAAINANTTYGSSSGVWGSNAPLGYSIVNSASISFRLRQTPIQSDPNGTLVMHLEIGSLSDCDVRTCLPVLNSAGTLAGGVGPLDQRLRFEGWRVFSPSYLSENNLFGFSLADPRDQTAFLANIAGGPDNDLLSLTRRSRLLGWLYSTEGALTGPVPGEDLFVNNETRRIEYLQSQDIEPDEIVLNSPTLFIAATSLCDGEIHAAIYRGEYVDYNTPEAGSGSDHIFTDSDPEIGPYGSMAILFGVAAWATSFNQNLEGAAEGDLLPEGFNFASSLERIGGQLINSGGVGAADDGAGDPTDLYEFTQTTSTAGPRAEIATDIFLGETDFSGAFRTFKTNATHALGIIHYDQRGRPGNVRPLPTVFVPGYSPAERGGTGRQGRVGMEIALLSDPPDWAFYYQLVYAGSSTVQDFIQYSVGGGYHAIDSEEEALNNIYVSLNYLQFNPSVSYAEAFGAVHPDGTSDLYVYSPGDYLRVISYFTDDTTQIYPSNLIFEIAGQVTLTSDSDTNPLMEADNVDAVHLTGQFLILKNNQQSGGFSFESVLLDNNNPQGDNFWRGRCIVEIVTPNRLAEGDEIVYRETSQVYNVARNNTGVYYQTPTLLFANGDVWWRAVPVNINDYQDSSFINIIQPDVDALGNDNPFSTQPRFRSVYLETDTFNDTFPGCDVNGLGKVKRYKPDAAQVRRFSSVIFSDENNYSVRRLRFTVFNPYLAPFKDLPNEFGNINALLNYNDSLFVVQEDKVSMLPVNRQIISDVLGAESLIATSKVVGNQQMMPSSAGADNNRESVIKVDDSVYFAHKTKKQVYRYNPKKGVEVISDAGMNAYFVDTFEEYGYGDLVRVVSGYDPLNDEYIITVMTTNVIASNAYSTYTQPDLALLGDQGGGNSGGFSPGEDGDGITEWDDTYGGPIEELVDEVVDTGGTAPDGVVPTDADPYPPTNPPGTVSVADFNKDRILDYFNGNSPTGYNPPYEPTSWDDASGDPTTGVTISTKGVFTDGAAGTLGDFTLTNGEGAYLGNFKASSGLITEVNTNIDPANGLADISVGLTDIANYEDYLDNNLIQSNNPNLPGVTLRQALQIRSLALADTILDIIVGLKTGPEDQIVQLITDIGDTVIDVSDQLSLAGLSTEPNIAVLLNATVLANQELQDYMSTVMMAGPSISIQYVSKYKPSTIVTGLTSFQLSDYPLSGPEINSLSQLKSLVNNVGDSITPLLNLNSIDISSAVARLIDTASTLRGQVDVLADQVQALSDAPSSFAPGAASFIPNVTSGQLESTTISTIAGDGVLGFNDVQRDFSLESIQFIVDNLGLSNPGAIELEPDAVARLAFEVLGNLAGADVTATSPDELDGNSLSSDKPNLSLQSLGNLVSNSSNPTATILSNYTAFVDPYNITGSAGYTTADLLASFSRYNDPDTSGLGLYNSQFPAAPLLPSLNMISAYQSWLDSATVSSDPFDAWLATANAAGLTFENRWGPNANGGAKDWNTKFVIRTKFFQWIKGGYLFWNPETEDYAYTMVPSPDDPTVMITKLEADNIAIAPISPNSLLLDNQSMPINNDALVYLGLIEFAPFSFILDLIYGGIPSPPKWFYITLAYRRLVDGGNANPTINQVALETEVGIEENAEWSITNPQNAIAGSNFFGRRSGNGTNLSAASINQAIVDAINNYNA